ncbi:MAG: MarR family transcriptional regulator [Clostridiales bacterium]|nr:MarR family transcriptional regulator [Clostridiales bacterium]
MNAGMEFVQKIVLGYDAFCKPLCRELGLSKTSFDILMFLANNPSYKTARDIVEVRHIKANLVSVHIERLVREGYLVRKAVQEDRRKVELICTEQAASVVERGRELQNSFFNCLFYDTDNNMRQAFFSTMKIIEKNVDAILEEKI